MFLPGSKIIVMRSSITKGKIGPRVGSLGYVVHSDEKSAVWASCSSDVKVVIVDCCINYIRYGFEKTFRNECKRSLCLFPAMSHLHIRDSLGELSNILRSDKHKTARASIVRGLLHSQYGEGKVPPYKEGKVPPIVVVMPVKNTQSLLHCHDKEFVAWADSLIRSPLLYKTRPSNHNIFAKLAVSVVNRKRVLNYAVGSIEGRSELIRRFKREAALYFRDRLKESVLLTGPFRETAYSSNINNMIGKYLFWPGIVKTSTTAAERELLESLNHNRVCRANERLFDVLCKYEREASKISRL
jgi:hypothetical protein